METISLLDNHKKMITLNGVLPAVRRLSSVDKLRLIRILAEELDQNEYIFPFEPDKIYELPTPYNIFGAGEILMDTLKQSNTDK
jgi:hypothetical protein